MTSIQHMPDQPTSQQIMDAALNEERAEFLRDMGLAHIARELFALYLLDTNPSSSVPLADMPPTIRAHFHGVARLAHHCLDRGWILNAIRKVQERVIEEGPGRGSQDAMTCEEAITEGILAFLELASEATRAVEQ